MASRGNMPKKVDGLHVQELDGEFVVVDERTQQAHALSGVAADLWRGIDTGTWPSASDKALDAAVAELAELGLVESAGLSRRMILRGGTVAVAGAVITIGLPTMAMAASTVATATTATSVPASPIPGTSFQIHVTVAPPPTGGTVTLTRTRSGMTPLTTAATGGSVSFNVTAGADGVTDTYTATFSGSTGFASSSGTVNVTYAKATPTLTNSAAVTLHQITGATYQMTVAVTGTAGIPTGTVTVSTSGSAGGTSATPSPATLTAGVASFTIANPNSNGKTVKLTFNYSGDSNYATGAPLVVSYTTS